MIIIIIVIFMINCYLHLEYRYLKYYLEYNSGKKLTSILNFWKFFTNLTHKKMSNPKYWNEK